MSKNKRGVCPECKVKEGDSSKKILYQCKFCERWFCAKHFEPRLVRIPDYDAFVKYPEVRVSLEKEKREDGHPDFAYSLKRFKELDMEKKLHSKLIEDALNRSKAYRKKTPKKEPHKITKEEERPYPSAFEKPTSKPTRKKRIAIYVATTVAVIVIAVFVVLIFVYFPVPRNEYNLPTASFIPSKTTDIFIGEEIIFNASLSYDPDNLQGSGITTYRWDFGDGTLIETVSSYTVIHSYALVKSYKVTLTVIDDDGQNATCTKSIEVKWEVPSISELGNWLTLDQTNEIDYDYPDFVCFDFAKMLANHARQKNWKMAVVCVYGYDTTTSLSWEHAINAINTTEGLVYTEPQTDEVWWYNNHVKMVSGNTYEFWSYPYQTVQVYIEDILVLHLEDLEKYDWIPPPLPMKE